MLEFQLNQYFDQQTISQTTRLGETYVIIQYNAHLKANEVMDDWNIETSNDP